MLYTHNYISFRVHFFPSLPLLDNFAFSLANVGAIGREFLPSFSLVVLPPLHFFVELSCCCFQLVLFEKGARRKAKEKPSGTTNY